MKKIIFTISIAFIAVTMNAQWNGSTNTTGDINRSGNVSIGTSNTSGGKLTIRQKTGDNKYSGLRLMNSSNNQSSFLFMDGNNKLRLENASNASRDLIINSDGNGGLGIGVYNPYGKLAISQKAGDDHYSGIQLKNGNGQSSFFWLDTNDNMRFDNASNASRNFVFNGSGSGNVGIGSINPDEKLTVKGTIHCEEVKVNLNVPADYVFEKYYTGESALKQDYVMPTLEEVEAYTKENNHLPEMPSAQEIKDNGLQLKEMTNLLLQKVEELTLYTIEQEKRIKALEAKLATANN